LIWLMLDCWPEGLGLGQDLDVKIPTSR
jgi:hypothetical protein